MQHASIGLVLAAVALAGCAPATTSDAGGIDAGLDASALVTTCEAAIASVVGLSCDFGCTTSVPCDFTTTCTLPNCPVRQVRCASGMLRVDAFGGPCDTSIPSLDAGPVVHTCDDARNAFAGRDCRNGCDAGGAPCDFTDACCVAPSVLVVCANGIIVTDTVGGDAGPCDWDAAVDAAGP